MWLAFCLEFPHYEYVFFGDVILTYIYNQKETKQNNTIREFMDDRSILVKFKVILRFACQNIVNVTKIKIQMNEEKRAAYAVCILFSEIYFKFVMLDIFGSIEELQ